MSDDFHESTCVVWCVLSVDFWGGGPMWSMSRYNLIITNERRGVSRGGGICGIMIALKFRAG